MPETKSLGLTHEAFESFLATRVEPSWLTEQRRSAWTFELDLRPWVEKW